jgi:hypothetical protein
MSKPRTPETVLPVLVRFSDLRAANIVASWLQLGRLIRDQGFPPGRYLGSKTRCWTADEVKAWLDDRPLAGEREQHTTEPEVVAS